MTIDADLMDKAGFYPYERILCGNLANGSRFETYIIPGPRGSGAIVLNGATAHLGKVGDRLTINALAGADSVLIPIQGQFYALYGVTQLMETINVVHTDLNRGLKVLGVVLTQVTPTRLAKEVIDREPAR